MLRSTIAGTAQQLLSVCLIDLVVRRQMTLVPRVRSLPPRRSRLNNPSHLQTIPTQHKHNDTVHMAAAVQSSTNLFRRLAWSATVPLEIRLAEATGSVNRYFVSRLGMCDWLHRLRALECEGGQGGAEWQEGGAEELVGKMDSSLWELSLVRGAATETEPWARELEPPSTAAECRASGHTFPPLHLSVTLSAHCPHEPADTRSKPHDTRTSPFSSQPSENTW